VGFGITSQNQRQMFGCRLFLKAELRFPIFFEVPPKLEILMQLPVKPPELVSVFIEASKNLKSILINN
jgi:hypothetical protein